MKLSVKEYFGKVAFGALALGLGAIVAPQLAYAGAYEGDRPGVTIFKANCSSCHGYDGTGDNGGYTTFVDERPAKDIRGYDVGDAVRQGKPPVMPGFNHEEISNTELAGLSQCVMNLSCLGANAPDPAHQYTVYAVDEDPWFQPYTLAVPTLPATIRFINAGQTWHTLTSANFLVGPEPIRPQPTYGTRGDVIQRMGNEINSGLWGRGGRYFLTLTDPGTYKYYCMLHPFMQIQVCAGSGTCNAPAYMSPAPTKPLPTTAGVGELWVAVQGINVPGKAVDTGAAVAPFPDLNATFDDFVKDGEIQVINLMNYNVSQHPAAAANTMNNPHYIWANRNATEMVVTNYLDNYLTMFDGSNKHVTVPMFTWGTTASHISGMFDGSMLWGPVQGDYGVQELKWSSLGSWNVGSLERITSTDERGHSGSMPHGIWAGGTGGSRYATANSRSNNATVFDTNPKGQATCGMGEFPLNPGLSAGNGPFKNGGASFSGNALATTNITNPTTAPSSLSVRLGSSAAVPCGTTGEIRVPLLGSGPVQTPPSPDDRFFGVSNGPYISVIDLAENFPPGSTCAGSTTFRVAAGFRICDINESSYGAHGVAWGRRADGVAGHRIYMPGKFVDFVAVTEVTLRGNPASGPVDITHVGDIPLRKYAGNRTCAQGQRSLAGCTETVPQGATTRPLPPPWM